MSNDFDSDAPSVGKIIGIFLVVFVVLMLLGWVVAGNDFFMYKFFAPKQENVRREVYTNTQSYKQGNTQRLNTLCSQVDTADDSHKALLNDIISHEFADWNSDAVPDYLRGCLARARAK